MNGNCKIVKAAAVGIALSSLIQGGCAVQQRQASTPPLSLAEACARGVDGARVVCKTVVVREHRGANADKSNRNIRLPVMQIMPADANDAGAIPTVVLGGGGPGGELDIADASSWNYFREQFLGADGELILADTRGAGEAVPRLTCPELGDAVRRILPHAMSAEADTARYMEAMLACFRRWRPRVDFTAYTAANMADDFEAVRRALGIAEWNVLGMSHGTRLALELIRRHPDGVRAAVLAGALPADAVRLPPARPLHSVLTRIADECAADARCRRYGDLRDNLDAAVARLQRRAVRVRVTVGDEAIGVRLTPSRLSEAVHIGLADVERVRQLPKVAAEMADGEWGSAALHGFLQDAVEWWTDADFADALLVGMSCLQTPFEIYDEADGERVFPVQVVSVREYLAFCAEVEEVTGAGVRYSPTPLVSDKPMLLIAGEYDPLTPVQHAEAMTARLPGARLVVVPASHAAIANECAMAYAREFLRGEGPAAGETVECEGGAGFE